MNTKPECTVTDFEFFTVAAGLFLCDELPDHWETMPEADQDEFCEQWAWQPFECADGDWIHRQIASHADSIKRFYIHKQEQQP